MAQDLATRLWSGILANPCQTFWISPDARHSYADLAAGIAAACGLFDVRGLGQGDILLIVTSDEWLVTRLFLAALLDGKVPVVLAADAGQDRVTAIRGKTEPALIVTDPARAGELWAIEAAVAGPEAMADAVVDPFTGQFGLMEGLSTSTPRPPRLTSKTDDTGYLLFTSGTTEAPKGVVLSHGNLAHQLDDLARVLLLDSRSCLFNGLVMAHTDGLIQGPVLAAWAGATLLRPPIFQIPRIDADLGMLARHGATHMLSVPTVYALIDRYAPCVDYFAHDGFRMMISTAAPLPSDLWARLERRFGRPMVNEYGMTETVAASHFAGPFPEMGGFGSVGRPVGCMAELRPVPGAPDGVGRLWLRGGQIFRGYFKDPSRTEQTLRDGWFDTGDLARCNAAGDYHILGRASTAMNIGGFIVLPQEIDEALLQHASVSAAQTIGVEDAAFGMVAMSAVVLEAPVEEAALLDRCRASLEVWKVPRRVVPLDALPMLDSGKTDLAALMVILREQAEPDVGMAETLEAQVMVVAARVFGADPATLCPTQTPDDIPGWDSYAHVALALAIEQHFSLQLRPRQVLDLECLGDVIALVRELTP